MKHTKKPQTKRPLKVAGRISKAAVARLELLGFFVIHSTF